MPRGVACPYYKVDVVLDVVVYPLERLIDERKWTVAARGLCTVDSCRPMSAMARCLLFGARVCLVEGVWVKI